MFNNARLKLTAWYLVIIMVISFVFSFIIYQLVSNEINRFAMSQRIRIERRINNNNDNYFLPPPPTIDDELIEETKNRLLLNLLIVNLGIISISGALSFFLAGKTLKPIAKMVEEQNRFISDSSHELRTPITALKSSLEVSLRDPKFTIQESKKLIKDNLEEVNHLQNLSDGLIKLIQSPTSNQKIIKTKNSLVEIIDRVLIRTRPLALKKNITIINRTKKLDFDCDQSSVVDLLVILIDNAIKYSPKNQKIILRSEIKNNHLYLSVKDHGIGIDDKDIPHIFDRFYRADQSRSKVDVGGYGLGLSIAKKIIDQHHGHITVRSIPNKGAIFTVIFQI